MKRDAAKNQPVGNIVSLLPSATEIVCALGFRDALVGRSHECDFPSEVGALPVLTAPKLDPRAPSAEIDRRVKRLVAEGLSVYRVDAERLRELAPSHILTQDQCEVCAASLADVEDALTKWLGERPSIVSLRPSTLGDVWDDIQHVADALGAPDRGREVVRMLSGRITEVGERSAALRNRPRVACVEWIDPLMAAGNWMPELVTLAASQNLFGEAAAASAGLGWDALREADPDVLILMPCGFDLARTRSELASLRNQPGWDALRAVRERRVYLTDGHQYFNRPGPRLVESLEILAELLHPDEFPARHRSTGWEPW